MIKFILQIFVVLIFSINAFAQFADFPTGFSGKPNAKLKGAVHTVLTIEQRDEKVFSTTVDVYDRQGKLIESMRSNAGIDIHSGNLIRSGGKTIYFYDADGKLVKEKNFAPEGDFSGSENYLYDEKGRIKEILIYDSKDKKIGNKTFIYFPEKRQVIFTWNFYYDGRTPPPMKNLLSYDEKGQWTTRTEYDRNGKEDGLITFEYDRAGNFIKEVHCCEYNYTHRYTYKFDKQGNWIERENTYIQLDKDEKEEISPGFKNEFRIITYYSEGEWKK